jgi:hypothetical protein
MAYVCVVVAFQAYIYCDFEYAMIAQKGDIDA